MKTLLIILTLSLTACTSQLSIHTTRKNGEGKSTTKSGVELRLDLDLQKIGTLLSPTSRSSTTDNPQTPPT